MSDRTVRKTYPRRLTGREPKTIFDMSSRSRMKVLRRLAIPCSICGWSEEVCDLHHILSKKDGGSDSHDNLCVLCPNCHRLAHAKKLTGRLLTFAETIGDTWKTVFFG